MRAMDILVVEDNPADAELLVDTFSDLALPHRLHVVDDGQKALDYLRQQAGYSEAARPALVLLDLNLPGIDGRTVLAEVRAEPALRRIPVVVLTSSDAERDLLHCYELGANAYVQKAEDLSGFSRIARTIDDFWFGLVTLPPS